MQKAVELAAMEFEKAVTLGYQADNRQTFAEYAAYVLDLKEREGAKYRTIERYRELMERINPAIGHIKLSDLRPRHLNDFYKNLSEPGISKQEAHAQAKIDLAGLLKEKKITRAKVSTLSGISATTVTAACQGKRIALTTAEAIARAIEKDVADLFEIEEVKAQLSNKTILEHHRLIHTILTQAEKEMLVQYNASAKATPPKAAKKEVNYFQPEDIVRIREALDKEPLKWKVATHLLLITGCRRGEVMGLRWDRVDFANSKIKIDTNLLYSAKRGIYEDTTKTILGNTFRIMMISFGQTFFMSILALLAFLATVVSFLLTPPLLLLIPGLFLIGYSSLSRNLFGKYIPSEASSRTRMCE